MRSNKWHRVDGRVMAIGVALGLAGFSSAAGDEWWRQTPTGTPDRTSPSAAQSEPPGKQRIDSAEPAGAERSDGAGGWWPSWQWPKWEVPTWGSSGSAAADAKATSRPAREPSPSVFDRVSDTSKQWGSSTKAWWGRTTKAINPFADRGQRSSSSRSASSGGGGWWWGGKEADRGPQTPNEVLGKARIY
jgi:hypothetical protein